MTAPESRPDIESTLADAFNRRHARQRPSLPSLVDVRRRAHRQSARRATMRAGAVVAAGATAVAGGWATTRENSSPSAVPAGPVTETPDTTTTTTTVTAGLRCFLTDTQIQALVEWVRALPGPRDAGPLPSPPAFIAECPSPPQGWTSYQLVAGDYLYGVAQRFCTTADELVARNGWADGVSHPLHPGDLIVVPADAC